MAEIGQLLRQLCVFIGQKRHGKQGGIGGTGFADGKRGHGHAFGHLHDGEQRIFAAQVFARHGHAEHGHGGFGGHHAGQVGCAAGTGDNGLDAARACSFGIFKHQIGSAVGGNHAGFESHAELLQKSGGVLHNRPVAVAAHNDADLNHVLLLKLML